MVQWCCLIVTKLFDQFRAHSVTAIVPPGIDRGSFRIAVMPARIVLVRLVQSVFFLGTPNGEVQVELREQWSLLHRKSDRCIRMQVGLTREAGGCVPCKHGHFGQVYSSCQVLPCCQSFSLSEYSYPRFVEIITAVTQ